MPSQKQLKWSQLRVGLTVLFASITLGVLIFLMSGTTGLFTPKITLKSYFDNAVEWAWAMNAASSVLGSVLAMVIAIHFGLNITVACGAAAYLLSLMLFPTLAPRRS